jgi:methylthioribose-1-phosphate isomerase
MQFLENRLRLLDQRLLPAEEVWLNCDSGEQVARAIEDMVVRGAPAIGCAAAFGLAIETERAAQSDFRGKTWQDFRPTYESVVARLARTRPTAVNLFYALNKMQELELAPTATMQQVTKVAKDTARALYDDDLRTCQAIGDHGATVAPNKGKLRILTHCNAGALATAGYGTALGVIRSLWKQGRVECVYADETRPYLQGSRLTAYELAAEGIPHVVIADSSAAYLMQLGKIDMAVVGADRIAANGDTANKIGTYSVAVNCHAHGIPFFVAAPWSTIDPATKTGKEIPVEERCATEISRFGERRLTPEKSPVFNPSFDVTPSRLISKIVTERAAYCGPYSF